MPEQLSPEIIPKSHWVPFRDKAMVVSPREEYGQIGWKPAFILHGQDTMIDVYGMNRWLQDMQIGFPVDIIPYHPPRIEENNANVTSVSQSGMATLGNSLILRRVPKPRLSAFLLDPETERQAIKVNFSGIDRYIRATEPHLDTKGFDQKYASMVNKAIKETGVSMIVQNFVLVTIKDNPHMFMELCGKGITDIVTAIAYACSLVALGAHGEMNLLSLSTITGVTVLLNQLGFMIFNLESLVHGLIDKIYNGENNDSFNDAYFRYLIDRDKDSPAKLVFPLNVIRHLHIPLAHAKSSKKLIKAAE